MTVIPLWGFIYLLLYYTIPWGDPGLGKEGGGILSNGYLKLFAFLLFLPFPGKTEDGFFFHFHLCFMLPNENYEFKIFDGFENSLPNSTKKSQ